MKIIETDRLILRPWENEDEEPFYQINQDPKVIEYLLGPLSKEEIRTFIHSMNQQLHDHGFALFATEEKISGKLIGYIGLNQPTWQAHFTPCVEIGWRMGSQFWNQGYATEGAKAVLNFAFKQCQLKEVVSFTVPENIRSIKVMERIGMTHDPKDDFFHPKLPPTHKLSQHVLFRIKSYTK